MFYHFHVIHTISTFPPHLCCEIQFVGLKALPTHTWITSGLIQDDIPENNFIFMPYTCKCKVFNLALTKVSVVDNKLLHNTKNYVSVQVCFHFIFFSSPYFLFSRYIYYTKPKRFNIMVTS